MKQAIRKRMNGEGGFTLIELLIVIVILGILAAIVVFAVNGITNKGTDSACKSDISTITNAAEAYYANGNPSTYAASIGALVTAGLIHASGTFTSTLGTTYAGNGYSIVYTVPASGDITVAGTLTGGGAC